MQNQIFEYNQIQGKFHISVCDGTPVADWQRLPYDYDWQRHSQILSVLELYNLDMMTKHKPFLSFNEVVLHLKIYEMLLNLNK